MNCPSAVAVARETCHGLAPTGTLRAAYIVANLAQATRDPQTGVVSGAAADIAREFRSPRGCSGEHDASLDRRHLQTTSTNMRSAAQQVSV